MELHELAHMIDLYKSDIGNASIEKELEKMILTELKRRNKE